MKVNIVSNCFNGKGLQVDCELLKSILESQNHEVRLVDFRVGLPSYAHLNIFIETIVPTHFDYAPKNWLIPNLEFTSEEDTNVFNRFDKILCKTQDAYRVLQEYSDRCVYIGFTTKDRYDGNIERQKKFLHVAGGSIVKGTLAILQAWQSMDWQHLTVIGDVFWDFPRQTNVERIQYVDDNLLTRLMNECQYLIQPSEYEGYGHILHEARSTGNVVITTDAWPMTERSTGDITVPVESTYQLRLAEMKRVSPINISKAVNKVLNLSQNDIDEISWFNRFQFQVDKEDFTNKFIGLLNG